jgi:hypothetical protein
MQAVSAIKLKFTVFMSDGTTKILQSKNFHLDLNLIRTDGGHGGENMDFRRPSDTIRNCR